MQSQLALKEGDRVLVATSRNVGFPTKGVPATVGSVNEHYRWMRCWFDNGHIDTFYANEVKRISVKAVTLKSGLRIRLRK